MGASLLAPAKSIYYEWASVGHGVDICLNLNICLNYNTHSKIQEKKEEEPRNKVSCFIVLIVLKTN